MLLRSQHATVHDRVAAQLVELKTTDQQRLLHPVPRCSHSPLTATTAAPLPLAPIRVNTSLLTHTLIPLTNLVAHSATASNVQHMASTWVHSLQYCLCNSATPPYLGQLLPPLLFELHLPQLFQLGLAQLLLLLLTPCVLAAAACPACCWQDESVAAQVPAGRRTVSQLLR
jgi:hypothetical protein